MNIDDDNGAGTPAGQDDLPQRTDVECARITELHAALYGIVYLGWPEHASEHRREIERGIGTETVSGRAWLAAFSALGVPVKRKL